MMIGTGLTPVLSRRPLGGDAPDPPPPSSTLNNGLIEAWNMNETGTFGTRYSVRTPGVGPAGQFTSASAEYLSVADHADLSGSDRDFSIATWFYVATDSDVNIFSKYGSGNNFEYALGRDAANDRVNWGVSNDGITLNTTVSTATNSALIGRWHYVVGYHDSVNDEIGVSLDGASFSTLSHTGGVFDGTERFILGALGVGLQYMNGRIMLTSFWDKVLSAAQVTRQYNEGRGLAYKDFNADDKTSLVTHWPCNEPSGVRKDYHTNGHDLTDNNTVTQALGVAPSARQFTAANSEYFTLADNSAFSGSDRAVTISARVYIDALAANTTIVSKWNTTGDQREYLLDVDASGNLDFNVSGDGTAGDTTTVTWGSTLSATTWYTIEAYHDPDGNVIGIVVDDGTPVTAAHTTGIHDGTAAFQVGRETGGNYFDGRIQMVRFWDKLLSSDDSLRNHNYGQGALHDEFNASLLISLVGSWDGDEKSGNLLDSSGGGYDLTDTATVTWSAGVDRGLSLGDANTVAAGTAIVGDQGADFELGLANYMAMPAIGALSFGDTPFTIAGHFNLESTGAQRTLVSKFHDSDGARREFQIHVTAGDVLGAYFQDTSGLIILTHGTALSAATDYSFIFEFDPTTDTVGLALDNGTPVIDAGATGGVTATVKSFEFGNEERAAAKYHDGILDAVAIFARVLTSGEKAEWTTGKEAPF